jgi:GTP cyclohydrolase I
VSAAVHSLTDEPTRSARPQLEVVDRSHEIDLARAERAVADLLATLGQDPASEQLLDTPRRVAAGYAELLTPVAFSPTGAVALRRRWSG